MVSGGFRWKSEIYVQNTSQDSVLAIYRVNVYDGFEYSKLQWVYLFLVIAASLLSSLICYFCLCVASYTCKTLRGCSEKNINLISEHVAYNFV